MSYIRCAMFYIFPADKEDVEEENGMVLRLVTGSLGWFNMYALVQTLPSSAQIAP